MLALHLGTNPIFNAVMPFAMIVVYLALVAYTIFLLDRHRHGAGVAFGGLVTLMSAVFCYLVIPGMPEILVGAYLIGGIFLLIVGTIGANMQHIQRAIFSIRYRLAPRSMKEFHAERYAAPADQPSVVSANASDGSAGFGTWQ